MDSTDTSEADAIDTNEADATDPEDSDRPELSPKALAERIDDLSPGDRVVLDDRDEPLEVVETDRYSVTLTDGAGTEYNVSQNLQSGEWMVHRRLRWLAAVEDS